MTVSWLFTNVGVGLQGLAALTPFSDMPLGLGESLEKAYFEQGEEYEKRNEMLKAVERYVDGLFNERIKSVSASPLTAESVSRIDRIMHAQEFSN
jgi:hypothetical protein